MKTKLMQGNDVVDDQHLASFQHARSVDLRRKLEARPTTEEHEILLVEQKRLKDVNHKVRFVRLTLWMSLTVFFY